MILLIVQLLSGALICKGALILWILIFWIISKKKGLTGHLQKLIDEII